MTPSIKPAAILGTVLLGLASLAAAMGIGRFAFTPLLPLMQQHEGLTLAQGAWLATANYAGYLVGSLTCFVLVPAAGTALRWGLLLVATATLAMAGVHGMAAWLVLRFAAGFASAFVLVGVSAWALPALAAAQRPALAGWVFAGVGTGIAVAGLVVLGLAAAGASVAAAWLVLGLGALAVPLWGWRAWGREALVASPSGPPRRERLDARGWALVTAYGGGGLGYILPATFLPAMARARVSDPAVFGWAWPVFGLAAAVSTVLVTTRFGSAAPRRVLVASLLVMAVGVLAPALWPTTTALVVAALCVGGSFMVLTMAGFQEARRLAGGSSSTRLLSAMTSSFAVGQLAGPVLVGSGRGATDSILGPSLVATGVMLGSVLLLLAVPGRPAAGP